MTDDGDGMEKKVKLGEFTMVSKPIRLILIDWFVFHLTKKN